MFDSFTHVFVVPSPETNAQERSKGPSKRKLTQRVRSSALNVDEFKRLSTISSSSANSREDGWSSTGAVFPEGPEDVSNWAFRRANISRSRPPPRPKPSPSSSQASSSQTISTPTQPNFTEVFELPANEMNTSAEQTTQDELDEDSVALAQAIERSIVEHRHRNRFTMGGTDLEELEAAIERSKYEI